MKRLKLILAAVSASNDVGYALPGLSEPQLVVVALVAMGRHRTGGAPRDGSTLRTTNEALRRSSATTPKPESGGLPDAHLLLYSSTEPA